MRTEFSRVVSALTVLVVASACVPAVQPDGTTEDAPLESAPVGGGSPSIAPTPTARHVAGDPDAAPPVPDVEPMLAHARAEVEALCSLTRGCCRARGQGSFDMGKCERAYASYGMQGDLADVQEPVLRGGKVAFDAGRSRACLDGIRALGCGRIEATAFSASTATCFATFKGTSRPTGACRTSLECQPGFFCEPVDPSMLPTSEAGSAPYTGKCMPVRTVAAPCERDEECSYRGLGRKCDPVAHRCSPKQELGATCMRAGECTSGLCTGTCVESIDELASADDCASFL